MPLISHPLPCKLLAGALLFLPGLCLSLQDVAHFCLLLGLWEETREAAWETGACMCETCVCDLCECEWCVCVYSNLSVVRAQLCLTPWTGACRAPLSVEFSRQEHWSGLPCNAGDLPDPEIEPESPASPALAGGFFTATPTLTDSTECATFVLGECTGMFASTLGGSDTLWFFFKSSFYSS